MSAQSEKGSDVRARRPASTAKSADDGTGEAAPDGIGVLDVVKALTPLLVIVGIALGMLALGYVFLPVTLSTSSLQQATASASAPSTTEPPPAAEDMAIDDYYTDDEDDTYCEKVQSAREVISGLKDFSRWRELGSKLRMPEEQLASIEADDSLKDSELKKRAMLRKWIEREHARVGRACWFRLVDALIALKEIGMARDIARANGIIFN